MCKGKQQSQSKGEQYLYVFLIDLIFSPLWNWLFISAWMHSAVCDTLCCFALPAVLCLPTFVEK